MWAEPLGMALITMELVCQGRVYFCHNQKRGLKRLLIDFQTGIRKPPHMSSQLSSIIKLVIWKLHSATENPQVCTIVLASSRSKIQGNGTQPYFHLLNLVGISKHRSPLTG